jgi:S-adenosylmethionine:tRNA ribosyltransferase-isomerase
VRTLESFADENGVLHPWQKETAIFIYPWYEWRFVESLVTNFHLPMSTLIMLVSALSNREFTLSAYHYAVENKFRFFSFWDAMWIK